MKRLIMKRLMAVLLVAVCCAVSVGAYAAEFDLKDYSVFTFGERQLVYQGPGETYYRHGNAAVGASNNTRLYGVLDGWLMIGYGYSTDKFRVGWVEIPAPDKDKRTVLSTSDTVGNLRFDMVLRTTVDECAATYDPVKISMRNIEIKKGATVNVLCWYGKWAYCEFKVEKKLSWGFMYANMLSPEPAAKAAPALRTDGRQQKTVLKETASNVPGGNYGVFSGPGEQYLRAEAGGAHVRPTDKCFIFGTEGDWSFVRVAGHYGYVPTAALTISKSKLRAVSFDCVPCVTVSDVPLQDAPEQDAETLAPLAAGETVNFLAWSDAAHHYAYVEYKSGETSARGFVPAGGIAMKTAAE